MKINFEEQVLRQDETLLQNPYFQDLLIFLLVLFIVNKILLLYNLKIIVPKYWKINKV